MMQRQISESLRCTPRYVTALIDALEADGLVRRGPHPTDRRATLVSLTRRGSAAAARMVAERQQAAGWLLGDIRPEELASFVTVANHVLGRISEVVPGPAAQEAKRSENDDDPQAPPASGGGHRSRTRGSGRQSRARTPRKEDG